MNKVYDYDDDNDNDVVLWKHDIDKSSKNCASSSLPRMNVSEYVGHVTMFICVFTISCCSVVGLGSGLDLVFGWIVVMHTLLL